MSRPAPTSHGPAADARATLTGADAAAFDRLAHALLASPSAPLGGLLRAQLPGTTGVRWLRQENLPPTTRPSGLTSGQWLSLFGCWRSASRAPSGGGAAGRTKGGRPSTHGHAPGATAIPRWGQ